MKRTMKLLLIISFGILSINTSQAATATIGPCAEQVCADYFKEYKKYARLGYTDAMFTLGEMYYYGHGTEKSIKKALKQYKSAAKWGSVKGQFKTAMMYLNEEEVKDKEDGVKYLKKAAKNNYISASFLLGVIYYSKDYFEQDFSEADKWLAKAYEKGHEKAATFVENMQGSQGFDSSKFPDLMEALAEKPIVTAKKASNTPKVQQATSTEKTEVITVYGTLPDLFDAQLASLRNKYPEKFAKATGSNIIGNTCKKSLSCGLGTSEDLAKMIGNIKDVSDMILHNKLAY